MQLFHHLNPGNWKLSQRLMIMGLVTALGTTSLLGILSIRASQQAILIQEKDALAVSCASRTNQAEQYFTIIREQMFNFAQNRMITEATDEFSKAFQTVAQDVGWETDRKSDAYRAGVGYFDQQFRPRLEEAGLNYRGAQVYTPADPNGIALQAMYIGNNPNPVGEKLRLERASEDCQYNELHAVFHPRIRDYLNSFGFYDIFLFDTEGNLVYSVFKETDYGTNFLNGPYADTNFGEVYREAVAATAATFSFGKFAQLLSSVCLVRVQERVLAGERDQRRLVPRFGTAGRGDSLRQLRPVGVFHASCPARPRSEDSAPIGADDW